MKDRTIGATRSWTVFSIPVGSHQPGKGSNAAPTSRRLPRRSKTKGAIADGDRAFIFVSSRRTSEVDLGAHAENHGIVGLHARAVVAASAGIDDVLRVELQVQPAGRLPAVPDFERNFVAAGVEAQRRTVHMGGAHREAD